MQTVYENPKGQPLPEGATDGMAEWIEEAEANGFEGEHVWDAAFESPPHPYGTKHDFGEKK